MTSLNVKNKISNWVLIGTYFWTKLFPEIIIAYLSVQSPQTEPEKFYLWYKNYLPGKCISAYIHKVVVILLVLKPETKSLH